MPSNALTHCTWENNWSWDRAVRTNQSSHKGWQCGLSLSQKKKAITANLSEDQLQPECTVNREFFRRPCLSVHSTSAQVSPSLEKEGSQNELWVGCIVLMKYLLSYPSVSTVLKRKKKEKDSVLTRKMAQWQRHHNIEHNSKLLSFNVWNMHLFPKQNSSTFSWVLDFVITSVIRDLCFEYHFFSRSLLAPDRFLTTTHKHGVIQKCVNKNCIFLL